MRLRDFDLRADLTFGDDEVSISSRLFHICESVVLWLRENPINDPPFAKILVNIFAGGIDEGMRREVIGSICYVDVIADPKALRGNYPSFRDEAVRCAERALSLIRTQIGWSNPSLDAFVSSRRGSERVCHHNLLALAKADRRGRALSVWIEVTESTTDIRAEVTDKSGAVIKVQPIIHLDRIDYLEDIFPAKSSIATDSGFAIRDKDKRVLANVAV